MNMTIRSLLLPLLLAAGFGTAAQAPTADENALLWKISSDNLPTHSYLFGTIHIIPEENFLLTEVTQKAFDSSARIAFEIDTEAMMNPMGMMALMSKMYMNNDTTLKDLLTEADYKRVDEHFTDMGLPMVIMGRIKPMFLSIMAGQDMKAGAKGMPSMGEGSKSYEMELTTRAQAQEKPIVGLETAAFQMSLFDSIPYAAQATMLMEAIDSEGDNSADAMLEKMVELYTSQNIVGMQELMHADEAGLGGYEELLLLKRNRNWIPIMEKLMMQERVFFAVGAGHLAGEEGVIALLRKAGYELTPIR